MRRKGFTLIEMLIVIAIIASLIAVAIPNYLSARQRASDLKKKENMAQLKTALRLYYNDYNSYPGGTNGMVMDGCGATGTDACPCATSAGPATSTISFATGAACDTVYMKSLPVGFLTRPTVYFYYQMSGGNDFCLSAGLDNQSDSDLLVSQNRCASSCSAKYPNPNTKYWVCAD